MPQQLALLICLILIVWLLWRDERVLAGAAATSWIPAVWLANISSKPISYWLGIGEGATRLEGNPVEALAHLLIFTAAGIVCVRRRLDAKGFVGRNKGLFILLAYFLLSALWSDYPLASLKRLAKELGQLLVLMVLLSEKKPISAFKVSVSRAAFVLLPLSLVVIRYYGELGRVYHHYSGEVMLVGVAPQKNSLGALACVCALGLIWRIADWRRSREKVDSWWDMAHVVAVLGLALYLLLLSNSKTSFVCFLVVISLYWLGSRPTFQKHRGVFLVSFGAGVAALFVAEEMFSVSDTALALLGRDRTLTERTDLWDAILRTDFNRVVGAGFHTFWDSVAGQGVRQETGLRVAHNGYLEVYLDGGLLALVLLAAMLVAACFKAGQTVVSVGGTVAVMKFAFIVMALLYNSAESSFFRLSVIWFLFLFAALRPPVRHLRAGAVERALWVGKTRRSVDEFAVSEQGRLWNPLRSLRGRVTVRTGMAAASG
jgi:exopolysaccharide production protein ExoQ